MTVMMWRWIRYEQWSSVNNPHRSRYYSNPADTVVISNSPCSASRCFNLIYYYYYHHLFSLLSEKKKSNSSCCGRRRSCRNTNFYWMWLDFYKVLVKKCETIAGVGYKCWFLLFGIIFFTKLINNFIAHFIVNC